METTTPPNDPEAPEMDVELDTATASRTDLSSSPGGQNLPGGERDEAITASRTTVLFIITAVAFFVIGYGVAWFSFSAATSAQVEAFRATVHDVVAEALSEANLAEARPQATDVAQLQATDRPTVVEVSADDDPAIGPSDAPIQIVEFSDFRCPYCARFQNQTLTPLLEAYEGQIRFVYRDFPVVGGEEAALAAECADDQGMFWEYHDLLFENQSALGSTDALYDLAGQLDLDMDTFRPCLEDQVYAGEIQKDFTDGVSYGVGGTPAFFINGRPIYGAQPLAAFRQVIDEILAEQAAG
jgi:protein-disulfide isomerase